MIKLITLDDARLAQAFVDHMLLQNITLVLQPDPQGVSVWLADAEALPEVEAELARFLQNPLEKRYAEASWKVAQPSARQFSYPHFSFWKKLKGSGVLTPLVILACAAIYFLWWIGFDNFLFTALHFPDGARQQWQLWRLVSHAFLHFSLLHLVLNLVWWWQLAGNVEYLLGRAKLLQILLLSALFSGFVQFLLSGVAFGGLSGVVYALLGYSWISGRMQPLRGLAISQATALFMLFWLFIGFAQPLTVNIANGAHVAGLLSGLGLGFLDCLQIGGRGRDLKK